MANRRIATFLRHLSTPSPVLSSGFVSGSVSKPQPSPGYEFVQIEQKGRVGIITLFRPSALNAINAGLVRDLNKALHYFDKECGDKIGCLILTGHGRAFAAGADIKEMKDQTYFEKSFKDTTIEGLCSVAATKLPIIAAVHGFVFGGGCELAMMCDIIIAAEGTKFGQPEITIGTIPGAGGTQRLTRAVGKSKAMEMTLTGLPIDAKEALQFGLVSQVVPGDKLLESALKMAQRIASLSRPVVLMNKESVNAAYETTLSAGMQYERKLFQGTFALKDQKEGMNAFASKRPPKFTHQ